MAKSQTHIEGIYSIWRPGQESDSFRVAVKAPNQAQFVISSKTQPLLAQVNQYVKTQKLRREQAENDLHFTVLRDNLYQELKSRYGLKSYRIKEMLDLKGKKFNFEKSLQDFSDYKAMHSVGRAYSSILKKFWFSFFIEKMGCEHPREFITFKIQARTHVRTAKNKFDRPYSPNTYITLTKPLNEYMRFCHDIGHIKKDELFELNAELTLEEKKRRKLNPVRSTKTYTTNQMTQMKSKIDIHYAGNPEWKLKSYAMLFGIYTGLRRGNLLGLYAENLHPEASPPHFQVKDNVVSGWSRGQKGTIVLEDATKTSHDENVKIPFIQPSKETITEVAHFLKKNLTPKQRLLSCNPDTVAKWWRKICNEVKIPYVHPHGWRHSYATLGAIHVNDWYKGNPYLLQKCCMHASFRTTEKYIQGTSDELLKIFAD
ncbi:MAG: hypothetical protein A4S09_06475 [Proteobacteria bacterium SG_bin7]|nr:MAG: hypothetical protein A4S09_06475 [Proteobacteria bacterium SG_bin7]